MIEKMIRARSKGVKLRTCQLFSTLVFSSNTKWAAGRRQMMRKSTSHSLSRSVFTWFIASNFCYSIILIQLLLNRKCSIFLTRSVQWEDEQFVNENPQLPPTYLDDLKIKATSVVVLYDDRTNRIVSFDVEPGFDHQWGYGRQRFMASSKLSGKLSLEPWKSSNLEVKWLIS